MSDALKTSLGGFWVQPGGSNQELFYLGCLTLEDIDEPLSALELIQCFGPDGKGWRTKGKKESPPDPVSTAIEQLIFPARNQLEKIDSEFAMYGMSRDGGRADNFLNYVRGVCIPDALKTSITHTGIIHRMEDNEQFKTYDVEGSELLKFWDLGVESLTTAQTENALDVSFVDIGNDRDGDCPDGAYSTAAAVLPQLDVTANSGLTWTQGAAQPFLIAEPANALVRFMIDKTTVRNLVARVGVAATLPEVAYSDDNGATWTQVVFPAGTGIAAQGAVKAGALFAIDAQHIWFCIGDAVAAAGGYIFFSSDGGATWTPQTEGLITTNDLHAIHFSDENNGVCVGASDTVLTTTNGGDSWIAGTATGGGNDLQCVRVLPGGRVWVGDNGAELYFSDDFGVTWTQRAGFVGSGAGDIVSMDWANDYQGIMLHNSAAPLGTVLVTVNGGFTWQALTTPVNLGFSAVAYCNGALAYAVGPVDAGALAAVMKVTV